MRGCVAFERHGTFAKSSEKHGKGNPFCTDLPSTNMLHARFCAGGTYMRRDGATSVFHSVRAPRSHIYCGPTLTPAVQVRSKRAQSSIVNCHAHAHSCAHTLFSADSLVPRMLLAVGSYGVGSSETAATTAPALMSDGSDSAFPPRLDAVGMSQQLLDAQEAKFPWQSPLFELPHARRAPMPVRQERQSKSAALGNEQYMLSPLPLRVRDGIAAQGHTAPAAPIAPTTATAPTTTATPGVTQGVATVPAMDSMALLPALPAVPAEQPRTAAEGSQRLRQPVSTSAALGMDGMHVARGALRPAPAAIAPPMGAIYAAALPRQPVGPDPTLQHEVVEGQAAHPSPRPALLPPHRAGRSPRLPPSEDELCPRLLRLDERLSPQGAHAYPVQPQSAAPAPPSLPRPIVAKLPVALPDPDGGSGTEDQACAAAVCSLDMDALLSSARRPQHDGAQVEPADTLLATAAVAPLAGLSPLRPSAQRAVAVMSDSAALEVHGSQSQQPSATSGAETSCGDCAVEQVADSTVVATHRHHHHRTLHHHHKHHERQHPALPHRPAPPTHGQPPRQRPQHQQLSEQPAHLRTVLAPLVTATHVGSDGDSGPAVSPWRDRSPRETTDPGPLSPSAASLAPLPVACATVVATSAAGVPVVMASALTVTTAAPVAHLPSAAAQSGRGIEQQQAQQQQQPQQPTLAAAQQSLSPSLAQQVPKQQPPSPVHHAHPEPLSLLVTAAASARGGAAKEDGVRAPAQLPSRSAAGRRGRRVQVTRPAPARSPKRSRQQPPPQPPLAALPKRASAVVAPNDSAAGGTQADAQVAVDASTRHDVASRAAAGTAQAGLPTADEAPSAPVPAGTTRTSLAGTSVSSSMHGQRAAAAVPEQAARASPTYSATASHHARPASMPSTATEAGVAATPASAVTPAPRMSSPPPSAPVGGSSRVPAARYSPTSSARQRAAGGAAGMDSELSAGSDADASPQPSPTDTLLMALADLGSDDEEEEEEAGDGTAAGGTLPRMDSSDDAAAQAEQAVSREAVEAADARVLRIFTPGGSVSAAAAVATAAPSADSWRQCIAQARASKSRGLWLRALQLCSAAVAKFPATAQGPEVAEALAERAQLYTALGLWCAPARRPRRALLRSCTAHLRAHAGRRR